MLPCCWAHYQDGCCFHLLLLLFLFSSIYLCCSIFICLKCCSFRCHCCNWQDEAINWKGSCVHVHIGRKNAPIVWLHHRYLTIIIEVSWYTRKSWTVQAVLTCSSLVSLCVFSFLLLSFVEMDFIWWSIA